MAVKINIMLNEFILVLAVSIDTFMVSLACGADCIKIPIKSALGVGIVGAVMMTVSVYCSEIVNNFIPANVSSGICCAILCAMGGMNIIKWIIEKHKHYKIESKEILDDKENSSILDVFICGSCADCDNSKEISIKEAIVVSFLMSLDSIAGGVAGGSNLNIWVVSISTLIVQSVTVWVGSLIGRKYANIPDVSFIGGLLLIILGITKVI